MNSQNVLLFEDLENTVEQILIKSARVNIDFHNYLLLLKNTGFRPQEAFEKNRIILHNSENFTFQPAKKNNVRLLSLSVIPTHLLYYYFGNSIVLQEYYYKRFSRILRRISNTHNYFVDGRSLGLYIFRYYYVRKLYVDGMSFEDIATHMGWKNQFLAFKYVTRPIIIK
jgi:hypothetical protein